MKKILKILLSIPFLLFFLSVFSQKNIVVQGFPTPVAGIGSGPSILFIRGDTLYNRGLVAAFGGVFSIRSDSSVLFTPDTLSVFATKWNVDSSILAALSSSSSWQSTLTVSPMLTSNNTIVNTGHTWQWNNGGTGVWQWYGLSHDTTNTAGLAAIASDSTQRTLLWPTVALKLQDYLPTAITTIGAPTTTYTNAATIVGNTLTLGFASVSLPGIVSAGTQTFAGTKTFNASVSLKHTLDASATPTIAAGAGAGTGPTISVTGTDQSGVVSITTGTSPTASSAIATITFNSSFTSTSGTVPILYPHNAAAAGISGIFTTSTTGTWTFTGTLAASTAYQWYYDIRMY
jgi:hypothetical protein